ncbi:Hypothetical_protein [Hexamita inflata]|uniref:Hypothetical_protein n=1 Tax=Hexamita inflata TaxID=28002 RepID=A0AA86QX29_9EUKA|nr:Hypothetical protein HINF_LOCUS55311 [Hexamita inflata]
MYDVQNTPCNTRRSLYGITMQRQKRNRRSLRNKSRNESRIYAQPLIQQVVSAPHSTERREQVNSKQIRTLSSCNTGRNHKKSVWNFLCKTTKHKHRFYAVSILQKCRFQEQTKKETDQRVMTLFPALNLEALAASPKIHISHPQDSYIDNFRGQQCQFKCRTNLGCLEAIQSDNPRI